MTEPIVTGVDILRKTLHARNRSPHALGMIAREIEGIGVSTLEGFIANQIDLTVAQLQALTTILYSNATYDPELNLLRTAKKPPTISQGAGPPKLDPASLPYACKPDPNRVYAIKPAKPEPVKERKPRPGWADGGFF